MLMTWFLLCQYALLKWPRWRTFLTPMRFQLVFVSTTISPSWFLSIHPLKVHHKLLLFWVVLLGLCLLLILAFLLVPLNPRYLPLVDRIERAMSANFMMMVYSGRITVINSLLTSIATYTMCAIKLPPKILENIDKIRRHCLWNKKTEDREHCNPLIAWDKVCRPKNKGGYGSP